ncbi:hypothetical protein Bbelb_244170 [Branchiostoma belcheri]|nr:hypothetical protein Bbelb_244170 [Branchiostoma belcheri]
MSIIPEASPSSSLYWQTEGTAGPDRAVLVTGNPRKLPGSTQNKARIGSNPRTPQDSHKPTADSTRLTNLWINLVQRTSLQNTDMQLGTSSLGARPHSILDTN